MVNSIPDALYILVIAIVILVEYLSRREHRQTYTGPWWDRFYREIEPHVPRKPGERHG